MVALKGKGLYLRGPLDKYLEELSARKIVPGGGSAAALSAALGAGLNLMVIGYSAHSEGIAEAGLRQREILDKLSGLIDEDCRAFSELMDAISQGKEAQEKYKAAAAVPMDICRQCHASMGVTTFLSKNGSTKLITDVGCAANMLKGAFVSAGLNVEVNLKEIKDAIFVEDTIKNLSLMEEDINAQLRNIENRVKKIMERGE
ncbi:MAG: cyclodeaminase/cyclohydrolase family protein [Candidatus Omnitrophota bacterium]